MTPSLAEGGADVQSMFNRVARRYDAANRIMSAAVVHSPTGIRFAGCQLAPRAAAQSGLGDRQITPVRGMPSGAASDRLRNVVYG